MKHPKSYDSTPEIRKRMSKVRLKNGKAETILAKRLWHEGYRYRRNYKKLPGSPDIALTTYRVAVFVDGEFWHGENWEERKAKLKHNREYWIEKIEENMARDKRVDAQLQEMGWTTVHFWEKQVLKHTDECLKIVIDKLEKQEQGDFICKTPQTALASLSYALNVSIETLLNVLRKDWAKAYGTYVNNDYTNDEYYDLGDFILKRAFQSCNYINDFPNIHWFHGTRIVDINAFRRNGLLPLDKIYPQIIELIDGIAKENGIEKVPVTTELQKMHREIINSKMSYKGDLGPSAMLMYDAVINPKKYENKDYTMEPEFIRDYTELQYGDKAGIIISGFLRVSRSAVVEFIQPSNAIDDNKIVDVLRTTILYLYNAIHNRGFDISCNTCFTGNGIAVPPENIVDIILLNK